jgi:hypothetical protein
VKWVRGAYVFTVPKSCSVKEFSFKIARRIAAAATDPAFFRRSFFVLARNAAAWHIYKRERRARQASSAILAKDRAPSRSYARRRPCVLVSTLELHGAVGAAGASSLTALRKVLRGEFAYLEPPRSAVAIQPLAGCACRVRHAEVPRYPSFRGIPGEPRGRNIYRDH